MMTFEQKLQEQFDELKVDLINQPKYHHHLYADYVELVCLISNDYVSSSDIIDRLIDSGMTFGDKKEVLDGEMGTIEAEIDDEKESWINQVFNIIEERVFIYKDNYPFSCETNKIMVREVLSSQNEFYIFLLLSSSLKFFKKLQGTLTSDFELLSAKVLKNYLPSHAVVKSFGDNSDFKGCAIEKIKQLADQLHIEVRDYEIKQISPMNSKEEGLDLIGWIPFSDSNPNSLIILVQCGCGKEWYVKKFETGRYEEFFDFYKQPPIHSLFIPYAISNRAGKFYQSKDIVKPTLVFERNRIIEFTLIFRCNCATCFGDVVPQKKE